MILGTRNVINLLLVSRDKIIHPSLYVKLRLMKQFVKVLDKNSICFNFICKSFPGLSNEKLKTEIFDDPQIRKPIKNINFINCIKLKL